MATNKTRSRSQREDRLVLVARLDRRGDTQTEIAKAIGISQVQVSYDLKIIRERYRETQIAEHNARVQEKLEQLREVRCTAWKAWDASRNDAIGEVEEFAETTDGEQRVKRSVTKKNRLPANEYLTTIMKTLEAERELLGLDASNEPTITLEQGLELVRAFKQAAQEVLAHNPDLLQAFKQRLIQIVPAPQACVPALPASS